MPLALARPRFGRAAHRSPIPPVSETDLDRILKLIPTEILALYTAAATFRAELSPYFLLALFAGGSALVPVVLYFDGSATGLAARWPQYVLRTLSFAIWATAIAWPFGPLWSSPGLHWVLPLAVLLVPFFGALVIS
jgi:hypothetical protein